MGRASSQVIEETYDEILEIYVEAIREAEKCEWAEDDYSCPVEHVKVAAEAVGKAVAEAHANTTVMVRVE